MYRYAISGKNYVKVWNWQRRHINNTELCSVDNIARQNLSAEIREAKSKRVSCIIVFKIRPPKRHFFVITLSIIFSVLLLARRVLKLGRQAEGNWCSGNTVTTLNVLWTEYVSSNSGNAKEKMNYWWNIVNLNVSICGVTK